MKKCISIFLSILFVLSLAGCSKEPVPNVTEEPANDEIISETLIVKPLPATIDLNNLTDCTLAVSLKDGDIFAAAEDSDALKMKVTVYDYELFDLADVSMLEIGSILEINKEQVEITSIETNDFGTVIINGGLDVGGYELITNENGVYYSIGYSDMKTYFEIGEAEFDLSPEFIYIDASDLDAGEKEYNAEDVISLEYAGTPHNTTIVVENGMVTVMKKVYTP